MPFSENGRNWIAEFVRKYVEDADSVEDLEPESVSVISFNYDQIFLDAVSNFLGQSERFSEASDSIIPRIYHVYGCLDIIDDLHPKTIGRQWENIEFIKEVSSDSKEINEIRSVISDSEVIYACGFSFDPRNVELIGLQNAAAKIYSVNYDGNREFSSRLKRLGVRDEHVLKGSEANPMSLARAVAQGFFSMHEL